MTTPQTDSVQPTIEMPDDDTILATLIEVAAQQTGIDSNIIKAQSTISEELGLDSLEVIEFVMELEKRFKDVGIPDELFHDLTKQGVLDTLGGYVGLVKAAIDLHNNPQIANTGELGKPVTATMSYTSQQLLLSVTESIAAAICRPAAMVQMAAPIMKIGICGGSAYDDLITDMNKKFGVELPDITGHQTGLSLLAMVGSRLWEKGRMSL
jgi:acyl carrier protein